MSCRETPLTYTATTFARISHPNMDDSQIQSIFHELRREGKEIGSLPPSEKEWKDALEKLRWSIRHDDTIKTSIKHRLLDRLGEARHGSLPTGDVWHAVQNIQIAAGYSDRRMNLLYEHIGEGLNQDPQEIKEIVNNWRENSDDYEDYILKNHRYRYDLLDGVPKDKRTSKALRKLGYEIYLAEPLPVFVYGTLRTGQHNSSLMEKANLKAIPAKISGATIYGASYGFPYAKETEDPDSVVIGEIVWLSQDENGQEARQSLDWLEGFDSDEPSNSHYIRSRRKVTYEENGEKKTQEAWVYLVPPKGRNFPDHERIHHGDWVAEKEKRRRSGLR